MKALEIIDTSIKEKEQRIKDAHSEHYRIDLLRIKDIGKVIDKYFAGNEVLEMYDVRTQVFNSKVVFNRSTEDYPNGKEMMTLYLREQWHFEENEDRSYYKDLEPNVYTSSDTSSFELERYIIVGAVCKIVLNHRDSILHDLNQADSTWRKSLNEAYEMKYRLNRELSKLELERRTALDNYGLFLLENEGLTFPEERPNLSIKYNYELRRVSSVKVLKVSSSGKSYDLDVCYSNINSAIVERVRRDNVMHLVRFYVQRYLNREKLEVAS